MRFAPLDRLATFLLKPPSGLRAEALENRVDTAANLATGIFHRNFKGHSVGKRLFAWAQANEWEAMTSAVLGKRLAGFEIKKGGSTVAVVHFAERDKPVVFVSKGSERLGRAVSLAFRDHAGWLSAPRVEVVGKAPSIAEMYKGALHYEGPSALHSSLRMLGRELRRGAG